VGGGGNVRKYYLLNDMRGRVRLAEVEGVDWTIGGRKNKSE
jgi:hypothetical protein